MYKKFASEEDSREIQVPANTSTKVPFVIPKGKAMVWRILIENYDIGFSVKVRVQELGGAVENEIENWCKCFAGDIVIGGRKAAAIDRQILLEFDNTYSKMRSKTLSYQMLVGTKADDVWAKLFEANSPQKEVTEELSSLLDPSGVVSNQPLVSPAEADVNENVEVMDASSLSTGISNFFYSVASSAQTVTSKAFQVLEEQAMASKMMSTFNGDVADDEAVDTPVSTTVNSDAVEGLRIAVDERGHGEVVDEFHDLEIQGNHDEGIESPYTSHEEASPQKLPVSDFIEAVAPELLQELHGSTALRYSSSDGCDQEAEMLPAETLASVDTLQENQTGTETDAINTAERVMSLERVGGDVDLYPEITDVPKALPVEPAHSASKQNLIAVETLAHLSFENVMSAAEYAPRPVDPAIDAHIGDKVPVGAGALVPEPVASADSEDEVAAEVVAAAAEVGTAAQEEAGPTESRAEDFEVAAADNEASAATVMGAAVLEEDTAAADVSAVAEEEVAAIEAGEDGEAEAEELADATSTPSKKNKKQKKKKQNR
jgi:hypothetical protein